MLSAVIAFAKKHPALLGILGLVLVALGLWRKAERLRTERDRAIFKAKDAHHEERIRTARERQAEAKAKGDALAAKRIAIDVKREKALKRENNRHRNNLEAIERKREEEKKNVSDVDFLHSRLHGGK